MPGDARAIRRAVSIPQMRGMRRSTTATSGLRVSIFASASSPSTGAPDDLDPVVFERVADRLDHRGMVVRNETGDGLWLVPGSRGRHRHPPFE